MTYSHAGARVPHLAFWYAGIMSMAHDATIPSTAEQRARHDEAPAAATSATHDAEVEQRDTLTVWLCRGHAFAPTAKRVWPHAEEARSVRSVPR